MPQRTTTCICGSYRRQKKQEQFEREHLRKQKGLEDAVAELTFLKGSGAAKHAALEEENAGLRAKMQELLNELQAYQQAESDGKNRPSPSSACIIRKGRPHGTFGKCVCRLGSSMKG